MPEDSRTPTKIASRLASTPPTATGSIPRGATADSNDSYKLDSGDRVRVVASGQDELSGSYEVDKSGMIELASIGKVTARGLSTVQLSGAIARRLKDGKARVTVEIETFRPFTIRGAVVNPGQYPYFNNLTAETAIAIAGGLTPGADSDAVTVTGEARSGIARPPLSFNSPVRPGDTITVTDAR
jgi:polysaccharide export outer membrane protein